MVKEVSTAMVVHAEDGAIWLFEVVELAIRVSYRANGSTEPAAVTIEWTDWVRIVSAMRSTK